MHHREICTGTPSGKPHRVPSRTVSGVFLRWSARGTPDDDVVDMTWYSTTTGIGCESLSDPTPTWTPRESRCAYPEDKDNGRKRKAPQIMKHEGMEDAREQRGS